MSELSFIGQRIGEQLLSSGLLSDVHIALQEKSLTLTLSPLPSGSLTQRILRFCVNFLGEQKPSVGSHEVFCWCAAFVEFPSDHACRVWVDCDLYIGYAGFDVLTELLLLGLRLSHLFISSLPYTDRTYRLESLMRLYSSKEEVLDRYARFVIEVIQAGDDLFTRECADALRSRWLCCPKHRFLFVQRVLLNEWLHHFLDTWSSQSDYDTIPDMEYLEHPLSHEEMKRLLAGLLVRTLSPQDWVRTRFTFAIQVEQQDWYRPIRHVCQRKQHMSFLCCPFHAALNALGCLFSMWLEHYDDLYHMREYVDAQGHDFGLFSVTGVALFIHLAGLETDTISFPEHFQRVRSVDVAAFHRQEKSVAHMNDRRRGESL